MLIKRTDRQPRRGTLAAAFANHSGGALNRRTFLRRSGLTAAGLASIGALPLASVRKADAAGIGCPVRVTSFAPSPLSSQRMNA